MNHTSNSPREQKQLLIDILKYDQAANLYSRMLNKKYFSITELLDELQFRDVINEKPTILMWLQALTNKQYITNYRWVSYPPQDNSSYFSTFSPATKGYFFSVVDNTQNIELPTVSLYVFLEVFNNTLEALSRFIPKFQIDNGRSYAVTVEENLNLLIFLV